jgi:membrane-associated phospholipid phosphatase
VAACPPTADGASPRPPSLWSRPALPPSARPLLVALVPISIVVVVVLGAVHAGDTAAGPVDRWVRLLVVARLFPSASDAFMVDYLGEPVGALLITVGLVACCLQLRHGRLAVVAVAAPVAAVAVPTMLKPVVDRRIHAGYLSYPSGHTAMITAAAVVVGLLVVDRLRRGAVVSSLVIVGVCVVAGGRMAFAQITLDAHYPTDTLGGFCVGLAVVPVAALIVDRLADVRAGRVEPAQPVARTGR